MLSNNMENQTYKPKAEIIMSESDKEITIEYRKQEDCWLSTHIDRNARRDKLIENARDIAKSLKKKNCQLGEYQVFNGYSSYGQYLLFGRIPTKKVNVRDYSTINFSILAEMLGLPEQKTLEAYAA